MSVTPLPAPLRTVTFVDGLDIESIQNIAKGLDADLTLHEGAAPGDPKGVVLVYDGLAMKSLDQVLEHPASVYVDVALNGQPLDKEGWQALSCRRPEPPQGGFCLSVTTATVYAHDISKPLIEKINRFLMLTEGRQRDIRLAFQEALANAALHGNLGLPSLCSPDLDMIEAYTETLNEALQDPARGKKPICVHVAWGDGRLSISIRDRGEGFDTAIPRDLPTDAVCGRGIPLMRQLSDDMAFTDKGRRVMLHFQL